MEAKEKHTSGVKTPFPKGRRIAGDESPAYRSGVACGVMFVVSHPFAKNAKGWGTRQLQLA
jgi:hypothetical protein